MKLSFPTAWFSEIFEPIDTVSKHPEFDIHPKRGLRVRAYRPGMLAEVLLPPSAFSVFTPSNSTFTLRDITWLDSLGALFDNQQSTVTLNLEDCLQISSDLEVSTPIHTEQSSPTLGLGPLDAAKLQFCISSDNRNMRNGVAAAGWLDAKLGIQYTTDRGVVLEAEGDLDDVTTELADIDVKTAPEGAIEHQYHQTRVDEMLSSLVHDGRELVISIADNGSLELEMPVADGNGRVLFVLLAIN